MKALFFAAVFMCSVSAMALDPVTKEINGTEVTQILKKLIPGGQTEGNLFGSDEQKVFYCKTLLMTTEGDDNFSEVKIVNEKTYKPTKTSVWFAKGVTYKYTRQDMHDPSSPHSEPDFYIQHTFQPKNSTDYTVLIKEDGDAGFDVIVKINKPSQELENLCQTDF